MAGETKSEQVITRVYPSQKEAIAQVAALDSIRLGYKVRETDVTRKWIEDGLAARGFAQPSRS